MALPPKLLAGGVSGVVGLSTVYVPALTLPALVVTFTNPVVALAGTVKINCVVDELVMVAGVPLTVIVLLTAVALNPVPTIVTLDPIFPWTGDMLDTVTPPLPPVDVGVKIITGFNCVLSFVVLEVPLILKSMTSPATTANPDAEYGYDVDGDMACEKSVVEFSTTVKVPLAGVSYNNAVPLNETVPAAGAVQRTTAPFNPPLYPWTNPLDHADRYN